MASPDLEALMLLQERHTELDQLRHRRAHLPERAALSELQAQAASHRARRQEVAAGLGVLETRQAETEAELAATEARITELDSRFYSGTVTASRDLMAMTEEIESLKRRRSHLEDRVLEVMTEREPADEEMAAIEEQLSALAADIDRVTAELTAAEAEIDAEIAQVEEARLAARALVPADLVERFEALSTKLGGVGAARLHGASCSGCHLTLPATELDRIRKAPDGTVLTCDQCGRILVP